MWVQNVLAMMQATPSLFNNFTNFTFIKFEELASWVMPIISSHARSTMKRTLMDEICWSSSFEKVTLGGQLHELPRCLGFIDMMLIEIWKLWKDLKHQTWFNGCKKIYTINNNVVLDHHGLFIYINLGSLGSYHDVKKFRHSTINTSPIGMNILSIF